MLCFKDSWLVEVPAREGFQVIHSIVLASCCIYKVTTQTVLNNAHSFSCTPQKKEKQTLGGMAHDGSIPKPIDKHVLLYAVNLVEVGTSFHADRNSSSAALGFTVLGFTSFCD